MPSTSLPAPACVALSPFPSAWPKAKLRDCGEEQVKTRSPSPERPISVDPRAPYASPKRRSSAKPRAISAATALAPKPRPAANVGRVIEAQGRPAQRIAERARQLFVGRGKRERGRQASRDVGGEGRAGENGRLPAG